MISISPTTRRRWSMTRKKLRVTVRRKKSRWTSRRKGRRITMHKKKSAWTAMRPDKGKLGLTPRHKQWSRKIKTPKSHELEGYSIDLPAEKRARIVRAEVRERGGGQKGRLSTARTMQKLINLNPSRKFDRVMRKDIRSFYPTWGRK